VKSDWRDFVLSGAFISLILMAAVACVALLRPWSTALLGEYRVLFDAALLLVSYGLLSALALRILLAIKPPALGEHSLDSPAFIYWKLLTVLYRLGQGALAWCTPVMFKPLLDALFGAKVGADVAFGGTIDDPYLVQVGRGTVLGNASLLSANYLSGGKLVCAPVRVGERVTIGANSVVLPGAVIGDGATLMSGSYLMPHTTIAAGETWRGNPARKWM
jgi:serine acetyltransferase